jgi:SEC-C motif
MDEKIVGRNEPCPCGSGNKYKRCCGKDAAPKLGKPGTLKLPGGAPGMPSGMPEGFDPSKLDPAMMAQFNNALMRMPRGQLQKLQSVMQRAMSGQDVSREAAELDRLMPPELKQLAASLGAGMAPESSAQMSEAEARKIIEQAARSGKISEQEAGELLSAQGSADAGGEGAGKKGGLSSLWKKVTGK